MCTRPGRLTRRCYHHGMRARGPHTTKRPPSQGAAPAKGAVMLCPQCGSPIAPGTAFCETCGADVRSVTQPAPAAPPQQPYAQQPTQPYPPQPYPAPAYQQPGYPQQPYAPAAAPKKSSGAIVGVVIAVLLLVAILAVGGYFFASGAFAPKKPGSTVATSTPAPVAVEPTESAPATDPTAELPIVTDAEARQVVTAFMEARLAQNVAASKLYCSQNFLNGESKDLINDRYWRPDSYEITLLTPDLMYIHVTVMGNWPSGREASIYSVWRDPESGKVVIDSMLDPEMFPELVTP